MPMWNVKKNLLLWISFSWSRFLTGLCPPPISEPGGRELGWKVQGDVLNTTHCHSGGPGKRNEIQPEDSPLLCQVVVALSCVLMELEERLLGNTFHTYQRLILISILRHLSSNSIRNHTLCFFTLVSLTLGKLLWSVTAQTGLLEMLIPLGILFGLYFIFKSLCVLGIRECAYE